MKKTLILIAFMAFGFAGKAQINTFPIPSGNVGINMTTTPLEELEVNGTTKTNQLILGNKNNVPSFINSWSEGTLSMNHFVNISLNPANERLWSYANFGKDYRIMTQSDDFSSVKIGFIIRRGTGINIDKVLFPEGNIGIGTMDPGDWKLAVNGKIRAKEIKVETGWADFVFEDNYDLPTLEEVEQHIQEKGHLKDIPSAKEVEKNGVMLGEMDAKLLQKIEELTLYMIELNKKVKALEAENKSLKEKLEN